MSLSHASWEHVGLAHSCVCCVPRPPALRLSATLQEVQVHLEWIESSQQATLPTRWALPGSADGRRQTNGLRGRQQRTTAAAATAQTSVGEGMLVRIISNVKS